VHQIPTEGFQLILFDLIGKVFQEQSTVIPTPSFQLILFDLIGKDGYRVRYEPKDRYRFQLILFDLIGKVVEVKEIKEAK
jgi:hypothetical protein